MASADYKLNYVHVDHRGAPVAMTNGAEVVVWRATYTPFGEATIDDDPDNDQKVETLNVRYPGQYYDKETGTYYNYYRDYDPSLGRYIQSDPIGLRGGLNTYGYAYQSPVMYIDPDGRIVLNPLTGAVAGFVAGSTGTFVGSYFFTDASFAESIESAWDGGLIGLTSGFVAGWGPASVPVGIGLDLLLNGASANASENNEDNCD